MHNLWNMLDESYFWFSCKSCREDTSGFRNNNHLLVAWLIDCASVMALTSDHQQFYGTIFILPLVMSLIIHTSTIYLMFVFFVFHARLHFSHPSFNAPSIHQFIQPFIQSAVLFIERFSKHAEWKKEMNERNKVPFYSSSIFPTSPPASNSFNHSFSTHSFFLFKNVCKGISEWKIFSIGVKK